MIGEHSVLLIPDPDVQAWGGQLASNSGMTTDLAGWGIQPFGAAVWVWDAGWCKATNMPAVNANRSWLVTRKTDSPIPRPASVLFRVRTRVEVSAATPVVLGLNFGKTAAAANGGPFWFPGDAINRSVTLWCAGAGTFTLEATFNPTDLGPEFAFLAPIVQVWPGNRNFPTPPRIDSIELQGQGGEAEDITCLVDQVTIHHGREGATGQPEAASATLDLTSELGTALVLPDSLEVGGIIRVETATPTINSVRFMGRITDISLAWEDLGEDTPDHSTCQLVAVSTLSDLGRRVVGDTPWPQELDGARVARILSAAGVSLDPTYSDPGTVQLLPRDVDAQPALDIAQAAAESAGGMVWHTRTGEVRYADAEHRRGATPTLELDACDVLVTPTWRRTTEGLLNAVSIGYGVAPEGGEQPRYTSSRADSQDRYGRYELSASTELALLADATAMGQLLLTRNVSPVWVMADLPVDVKHLTAEQTQALLSLDVHSLMDLTGLPVAGSAPTSATLWVEGWDETLVWGDHEITLAVSGYCRTAPAPRWDDSPPAQTWNTVNPASLTWDQASCLGPTPNLGRWDDVPASTRWNTVGAGATWDTWT